MEDKSKVLTEKLSNILIQETVDFFIEDVENKDKDFNAIAKIINVILSAHITSLSSTMIDFSKVDKKIEKKVKNFIDGLLKIIKYISPDATTEIVYKKKCPTNCQNGRLVMPGKIEYSTCPVCNGKDELKYN